MSINVGVLALSSFDILKGCEFELAKTGDELVDEMITHDLNI